MIHIFYNNSVDKLDDKTFDDLFSKMPEALQKSLLKFRKWEDIQRGLIGKNLLVYGLQSLQFSYSLNDIKYTTFKRPYINDQLDFNISHSGAYAICAIATGQKIGVDVEEIKDINIKEFTNEFSKKEMSDIASAENNLKQFYNLWTKKEAFLKAIGTGLYALTNEININNNTINWSKENWFLSEIKLDENYVAHICTNVSPIEFSVEQVDF